MFRRRKLIFWLLIVPGTVLGLLLVTGLLQAVGFYNFAHIFFTFGIFVAYFQLAEFYFERIARPQARRRSSTYGK